jgi:HEPN domain-containing protein
VTNPHLARDYLERSRKRLRAIETLLEEDAFADVVRESQEVVELLLKATLRSFGIAVPFSHDLSEAFAENEARLPEAAQSSVGRWCEISKSLRKDRELAFYGSEDVTPSKFYGREDALAAKGMAEEVLATTAPWIR